MLGIFRLVFPVYMIALTLSVAGVPLAISKLIAELHEKNDEDGIAKLFTSASIIGVIFGVLGFSVIMIGSSMFANMLGGQDTKLPLIVTSVCVINRTIYGGISRVFPRFWGYDSYRVVTSN